jgi:hypothetical protein
MPELYAATNSSTVAERIVIITAMLTMLTLVNTSKQRKTAARCWTGKFLGAANHKPREVTMLMNGRNTSGEW